ncbi:MAG: Hpt domain-containing protein, partial [Planctomycetes bacterium]|nr:Hpt domain-containing protein [Planctomycetota bacterium]
MTGSTPSSHPLVSQLLADDPDLRDIVVEFVDGLSTRIAELNSAHEKLDWERLKTLAHQLKGAGGSYGYPDITTLGAEMETAFRQN